MFSHFFFKKNPAKLRKLKANEDLPDKPLSFIYFFSFFFLFLFSFFFFLKKKTFLCGFFSKKLIANRRETLKRTKSIANAFHRKFKVQSELSEKLSHRPNKQQLIDKNILKKGLFSLCFCICFIFVQFESNKNFFFQSQQLKMNKRNPHGHLFSANLLLLFLLLFLSFLSFLKHNVIVGKIKETDNNSRFSNFKDY